MKIENQVSSALQSCRLSGLLQLGQWKNIDYNYYWVKTHASDPDYILYEASRVGGLVYVREKWPAFTLAELGIMLPVKIIFEKTQQVELKITRNSRWRLHYHSIDADMPFVLVEVAHKNEAMARAHMLIELLARKYISSQEVNKLLANE